MGKITCCEVKTETRILRGETAISKAHFCPSMNKNRLAQSRTSLVHLPLEPVNLRCHNSITDPDIINYPRPEGSCVEAIAYTDVLQSI